MSASCLGCAQLYTHCEDVEAVNARRLAELPGEAVRFRAQDTGRAEALQACQVSIVIAVTAVLTAGPAGNGDFVCCGTPWLSLQLAQGRCLQKATVHAHHSTNALRKCMRCSMSEELQAGARATLMHPGRKLAGGAIAVRGMRRARRRWT